MTLDIRTKIESYSFLIERFSSLRNCNSDTTGYRFILNEFNDLKENILSQNYQSSFLFNPIRQFVKLQETTHSKILAFLLDPNESHGQGALFLNSFLELLEIYEPHRGRWNITAEQGRIDILLKRSSPHSVVIIENKSNDAVDQPNQLYRYWHKEMFRHNLYNVDSTKNYKIIYLTATGSKTPNTNSYLKPSDIHGYDLIVSQQEHDTLPQTLPITPICMSFEPDISNWLSSVIKNIPPGNHRLTEFISQYIEIWKHI